MCFYNTLLSKFGVSLFNRFHDTGLCHKSSQEFQNVSGNETIKIDQFKRCEGALLIFLNVIFKGFLTVLVVVGRMSSLPFSRRMDYMQKGQ